jgi:hypothetical protein
MKYSLHVTAHGNRIKFLLHICLMTLSQISGFVKWTGGFIRITNTKGTSGKTKLNFMNQSPWEAPSCSELKETSNIWWNRKVYYHVHKSSLLHPALGQKNTAHITPASLPNIYFSIILNSTSNSCQGPVSFWCSRQNMSWSPCMLYVLPFSSSLTYHSNNIWSRAYIHKRITEEFSPTSYYFTFFGPNITSTLFANALSQSRRPDSNSTSAGNEVRMIPPTRSVRFSYHLTQWCDWLNWGMT